jgi:AmiR/NasT family two-component response regulator
MRRQAMESRVPIEQVANAVIEAENRLRPTSKHV